MKKNNNVEKNPRDDDRMFYKSFDNLIGAIDNINSDSIEDVYWLKKSNFL